MVLLDRARSHGSLQRQMAASSGKRYMAQGAQASVPCPDPLSPVASGTGAGRQPRGGWARPRLARPALGGSADGPGRVGNASSCSADSHFGG